MGSLLRPAGTRGGLAAVPAAPRPQDITVLMTSCTLGLRPPKASVLAPKHGGCSERTDPCKLGGGGELELLGSPHQCREHPRGTQAGGTAWLVPPGSKYFVFHPQISRRVRFPLSPAGLIPRGCKGHPINDSETPPKHSGRGGQSRGEASRAQPVPGGTQPAHVAVSPLLLIVSLHLFMVVNCSLLRLLPYSECCS